MVQPTEKEAIFMLHVLNNQEGKPKVNWPAVAEAVGLKNGAVASVRFGQIKKRLGWNEVGVNGKGANGGAAETDGTTTGVEGTPVNPKAAKTPRASKTAKTPKTASAKKTQTIGAFANKVTKPRGRPPGAAKKNELAAAEKRLAITIDDDEVMAVDDAGNGELALIEEDDKSMVAAALARSARAEQSADADVDGYNVGVVKRETSCGASAADHNDDMEVDSEVEGAVVKTESEGFADVHNDGELYERILSPAKTRANTPMKRGGMMKTIEAGNGRHGSEEDHLVTTVAKFEGQPQSGEGAYDDYRQAIAARFRAVPTIKGGPLALMQPEEDQQEVQVIGRAKIEQVEGCTAFEDAF